MREIGLGTTLGEKRGGRDRVRDNFRREVR